MTGREAVLLAGLAGLDLEPSQPEIYDRPIGVRLLYQDPASGAEHYLIHYPKGLGATRHRHTAAHTIVVLEGVLVANGQPLGPGSYCHFPAGTTMDHGPGPGHDCLFVTVFDGPFDVIPSRDHTEPPAEPGTGPTPRPAGGAAPAP